MNNFRMGTPLCGLLLGTLIAVITLLIMLVGFWKMLLVVALFIAGYFLGSTVNKTENIKKIINNVTKKNQE